jgi:hypothetical protein
MIKIHYTHVWKCHDDPLTLYNLIYAYLKKKKKKVSLDK